MEWQVILALVVAIPIILIPIALVWYINVGGIYLAIKEARARRAARAQVEKILAATSQKQ